jgi:transcriptional regulator with XRE-family HTH domain
LLKNLNSEKGKIQKYKKKVKDLRTKQGLSQEELAEKTGLSLRTIQRIENGESIPRGDTLKRLSVNSNEA